MNEIFTENNIETVPVFGYELLREVLIPDLLGKDAAEILYWAGKKLARKYPLKSYEEAVHFFQEAGWGQLTLKSEKKNEQEFELEGPIVTKRLSKKEECFFQLEAGFLAQQIEHQKNVVSEGYEQPKKRGGKVQFTIKWDSKDSSPY
nr:YslB family protein [Bacillus sp. 03113]